MEVGVLVATVPQLGISVLPRSRFAEKLGTRYLYVFHSMASTHMIYEPDGFDHYDTVMCVGPYMVDEIRAREAREGLPAKELVEHGYGRLDSILADRSPEPRPVAERPTVLVAPSWGPTCTFETIGADVVRTLLDGGCRVIARPHPMTKKRSPGVVEQLAATFASHPDFTLDEDIAATRSLHESDVMVSDWSGAALEYAFGLERPVVFLDVDRKVNNEDYGALGIEPFEASVRDQIGVVVDPTDLSTLVPAVHQMTGSSAEWRSRLQAAREANIFNVGHSGRVAAEAIAQAATAFTQARGR
jgi:YidC/Oxa1 family membrane protein insertase